MKKILLLLLGICMLAVFASQQVYSQQHLRMPMELTPGLLFPSFKNSLSDKGYTDTNAWNISTLFKQYTDGNNLVEYKYTNTPGPIGGFNVAAFYSFFTNRGQDLVALKIFFSDTANFIAIKKAISLKIGEPVVDSAHIANCCNSYFEWKDIDLRICLTAKDTRGGNSCLLEYEDIKLLEMSKEAQKTTTSTGF